MAIRTILESPQHADAGTVTLRELPPYIGAGVHFRKFFWKFEGLAESRLPEISLEIWGLGEKSWGEI